MTNPGSQNETRLVRRKRMVAEMSNLRTLKWVGVAFVIHLVLITATSTSTIRTFVHAHQWFGLQPLPVAPVADADKTPTLPEPPPATKPAATVVNKPGMSEEDKKIAELSKGGNVEAKKLTDTAKSGELPKAPSLGLKINEDP